MRQGSPSPLSPSHSHHTLTGFLETVLGELAAQDFLEHQSTSSASLAASSARMQTNAGGPVWLWSDAAVADCHICTTGSIIDAWGLGHDKPAGKAAPHAVCHLCCVPVAMCLSCLVLCYNEFAFDKLSCSPTDVHARSSTRSRTLPVNLWSPEAPLPSKTARRQIIFMLPSTLDPQPLRCRSY